MKIAVTSVGKTEQEPVSERFARCNYFVIYDSETLVFSAVENIAKEEGSGAGNKAVKILSDNDVSIVLGPKVGPNALEALEAFEIKIFDFKNAKTPQDAIYQYLGKELPPITTPIKNKHKWKLHY